MAGGVNYLSDHNSRPALDWLMPENPPSSTTRYALAIIGLTALCTGWLWSSMNTAAVTSDVSQAISVARNLAAGDGITTDIIYYEEHHRIGRVPAAQTVFPPGLPLCLALLQPFVTDPLSGAMIVAATGFFLVPIATFLLGRRLGLSAQASCLVAALWLTVGTAWTNALHLATDVPFLALTLLSANSLADPRASRRRLLLSGRVWCSLRGQGAGAVQSELLAGRRHQGRQQLRRREDTDRLCPWCLPSPLEPDGLRPNPTVRRQSG